MTSWNLNDHEPEPLPTGEILPFGGNYDVNVDESKITQQEAGVSQYGDGEAYDAYDRLELSFTVIDAWKPNHSVNLNRKLYRNVNLDKQVAVERLSSVLWPKDIIFKNKEELVAQINEGKLMGLTLHVSCWKSKEGKQAFRFVAPRENVPVQQSAEQKANTNFDL